MSLFVRQQGTLCEFRGSDSWVILSPIEQSIKRKIEAVGIPLKDWDIQINYGIKTGCNEAFIVSTEKRQEILEHCADYNPALPYDFASPQASLPDGYDPQGEFARTAELIRPILCGRDIKRYGYNWAGLWLIYLPWHFPYQFDDSIQGASQKAEEAFHSQYPAVYQHMLQYKDILSKRNKAETGIRYEWYALQRWGANYWDDFSKPKIMYSETNSAFGTKLAFVNEGFFTDKTCFIITGGNESEVRHVYEQLKSNVFSWYMRRTAPLLGVSGISLTKDAVELFPVCPVGKSYKLSYEEQEYIDTEVE